MPDGGDNKRQIETPSLSWIGPTDMGVVISYLACVTLTSATGNDVEIKVDLVQSGVEIVASGTSHETIQIVIEWCRSIRINTTHDVVECRHIISTGVMCCDGETGKHIRVTIRHL